MIDILFIKTSSLGDVVHHMPAVTEAHKALPEARLTWLVEEAFAPLVRLHPAVADVIPVAWRRWRRSLWAPATLGEIARSLRRMRARRYDAIVDSQGLLRSAALARLARGVRHGYDAASIREPPAARLYDRRHAVGRDRHAVERNRALSGLALGYVPQGDPDFGLDRARFARAEARYAVLLHATARADKEWPEGHWIALGQALAARGLALVLPWGTAEERARSERIAAALPRARVPERAPLDEVARLIAGARLAVGVDTGLTHLAAALGVPLVAIFTGSDPRLTAPVGRGPVTVLGARGRAPALADVEKAAESLAL
ncbi:MAG: lipopolysaccharide heptosyltransferase I [Pseudolabrys sp.]|nr:lipopolysaccharide heptosyltransferase I [Pseudolabrys sp.]